VSRSFVFLDRDGTLIEDRGYAYRLADYAPLAGAYEAVRALRAAGFGTAIITNQSGIARGRFDEADFARFQAHLLADFAAQGAALDASYHCPHLPNDGCECRKPRPGMLLRARRELGADLARSWVIGDKESDVELAHAAGCAAVLLGEPGAPRADGVPLAPDVLAAARLVLAEPR
jgi:D-glycero-D-manno-heptose 1,7-bisphosphate phosphatase